jgi:hypothetical protein
MALVENDGFDVSGHVARQIDAGSFPKPSRRQRPADLCARDSKQGTGDTLGRTADVRFKCGLGHCKRVSLMTGDWNQAIIATRQDITYKMLDQASIHDENGDLVYNFAQQDMVGLRCVGRYAYQIANAVNREGTYGSQSAFGVLHPIGWTP